MLCTIKQLLPRSSKSSVSNFLFVVVNLQYLSIVRDPGASPAGPASVGTGCAATASYSSSTPSKGQGDCYSKLKQFGRSEWEKGRRSASWMREWCADMLSTTVLAARIQYEQLESPDLLQGRRQCRTSNPLHPQPIRSTAAQTVADAETGPSRASPSKSTSVKPNTL